MNTLTILWRAFTTRSPKPSERWRSRIDGTTRAYIIGLRDHHITKEAVDRLSKKLADEGKIIAAGFVGLRLSAVPPDAPQSQVDDMEFAFMCGAQHLFASIMATLDPDAEPTAADLRRMDLIDKELRAFAVRLQQRVHGQGH